MDLFNLVMKTNKYGDHAAFLGNLFRCLIVLEAFPLVILSLKCSCFNLWLFQPSILHCCEEPACVLLIRLSGRMLLSPAWSLFFSRFDKLGSFSFSSQGKCSSLEHLSLPSTELTPVYWSLAPVGPKVSHCLQLLVYRNNFLLFFQQFWGVETL